MRRLVEYSHNYARYCSGRAFAPPCRLYDPDLACARPAPLPIAATKAPGARSECADAGLPAYAPASGRHGVGGHGHPRPGCDTSVPSRIRETRGRALTNQYSVVLFGRSDRIRPDSSMERRSSVAASVQNGGRDPACYGPRTVDVRGDLTGRWFFGRITIPRI